MKPSLAKFLFVAVLVLGFAPPVLAQTDAEDFFRPWVDYRNGEITMDFDQTPVVFALHAIQAKTGFQIVVPSTSETKLVNLKLRQQPLEPAVRSLITMIGYSNFAMLYDERGRPRRAVVLGARAENAVEETSAGNTEAAATLSDEEKDKLQKDLERWNDLKQEARGRIEDRLKSLPASEERDQLVKLYGKQLLGLTK